MKKNFLSLWVLILFILSMNLSWGGFVEPPNIPKNWSAPNFEFNKSPMAIATAPDPGTVIVWAERDPANYRNMNIYGTLWNGTKTLIDTISPDDMNADPCPPEAECGVLNIPEIDITSQPVHDGIRNCFYVAVLAYDECPLCQDQEQASRTETWVEVYKLWNVSGTLQSLSIGQFGDNNNPYAPTLIREVVEGAPISLQYSTKIHDVAIEKAVYWGTTYVYLYYIYSDYWENNGDPYYYVYYRTIYPIYDSISGYSYLYEWDEDCDTGMLVTNHCISATYDEYSDRIWLIWNHMIENCTQWYASVGKTYEDGTLQTTFDYCKSDVIACQISADNNASYSRLGICWKDTSDGYIKAAPVSDSGVGTSVIVSGDSWGDDPDITYINNGYYAIVYGSGSIKITKWYSGPPDSIDTGVEIAKDQVIGSLNPTSGNVYPRIATYPGANSGEFYVAWKGMDSSYSGRIIGKHSGTNPFRTTTYYCYLGWQITGLVNFTFVPNWSSIEANDNYGDANKSCEMEFNTMSFASGDQVYFSQIRAYLTVNTCTFKSAKMTLLNNPRQLGIGTGLPDLADQSEGTGWTEWKNISYGYNYFTRRPNGHDYFYNWFEEPDIPLNQRIVISIGSNRPQLNLYYIDWQP